jgi:hypothetical protein
LELFSLKEKVTLLPGGLFVCEPENNSSRPRFVFAAILASDFFSSSNCRSVTRRPSPLESTLQRVFTSGAHACSGQLYWIATLKENRSLVDGIE